VQFIRSFDFSLMLMRALRLTSLDKDY